MAIRMRRGAYGDFDATKMLAGELAVVESGDPDTEDGTGVYVGTEDGDAKRVAWAGEVAGTVTYAVADGDLTISIE